jgi:hypothetical protein
MQTASLELCKRLYELSGWFDTDLIVDPASGAISITTATTNTEDAPWIPAYDLGYLLRKLPPVSYVIKAKRFEADHRHHKKFADIPEDAVAKLCIELFEIGVLKENQ